MIDVIKQYYIDNGAYGPTWGDQRWSQIGLVTADWKQYINHIQYTPRGGQLLVSIENGYSMTMKDINGNDITLTSRSNWNLIYDITKGKWYYRSDQDEVNQVFVDNVILPE